MTTFSDTLASGYGFTDPAITLGAAIEHGTTHPEPKVRIPLAMMNRHGLVAGATGTGKTRTLQLMAEQLSNAGVPVFISDIKGDLQGLAVPGESNERITSRAADTGYEWKPAASPVEFVSLTGKLGAQLRATVSSFGPLLLSKVLELNETQASVLAMVFKYCDDQGLLLLDFSDLRAVLQFLTSDDGKDELRDYGALSRASVGVLLRKMVQLEEQGAEQFFGEPEFDVHDLLATAPDGRGIITCLEVADIQDKPALYSTFMMWLLAQLYHTLPEEGDLPKPKLAFFFDEAHLLFDDAPKAFLDQVEQVVRLIRSKGVGIFFVTQTPKDVPSDVLAQLGNRVQHALRAHTPDDEAALRATARTYPKTEFYDLEETLTTLGTGEAVVSGLNPKGVPTPVVACRLIPPAARMDTLTPDEFKAELSQSDLMREYGTPVDRESAREMLAKRVEGSRGREVEGDAEAPRRRAVKPSRDTAMQTSTKRVLGALGTSVGRAVGNALVRGVLGALGVRTTARRTTRTRNWF
ncbi:MAG TPA: helicase HerA-like domain-containing protein [Gemmatimonadales bacterium]|jgi:DNA helicase HerA-like ATPase|nr:helicase HerA-like domain-containing protein [Gemmatimonadales bacterium]